VVHSRGKWICFIYGVALLSAINSVLYGQAGGHVYQFLENPYNARIEALGGKVISNPENDISLVHQNPALLTSGMDGQLAMNSVFYYAGINYGASQYAFRTNRLGMVSTGAQYMYYGKFTEANEAGVKTGEFTAGDVALNASWAYIIDSAFTVGVSVKPVFSILHTYRSVGLGISGGVLYSSSSGLFNAAFVVDNLGTQITRYHDDDPRGPLPLNISLGLTQRLEHAPFRFSLTAQHLETPNLTYDLPEENVQLDLLTEEEPQENIVDRSIDYFMRHVVVGVEFLPSDNFYFALGYNFRRREELKVEDKPGFVGFSWGAGLHLKRFSISYGRAAYHLSGGTNYVSIVMNLKQWNNLL